MHVDRRAVGAVVVPDRIGLRGNNDRGRSDLGHDTQYAFKLARSEANAPNARASHILKLGR